MGKKERNVLNLVIKIKNYMYLDRSLLKNVKRIDLVEHT